MAWVICRANETVAGHASGLTSQELLAWFGLKGRVSHRAEPLLRANRVDPHRLYGSVALGAPDLLTRGDGRTSSRRGTGGPATEEQAAGGTPVALTGSSLE